MTKEEAVRYLIKPICTSTIESEEYRKQLEAYTMAVESLNGREEIRMTDVIAMIKYNISRLKQCITCRCDPEECGCDESDEDENGMCKKWVRK